MPAPPLAMATARGVALTPSQRTKRPLDTVHTITRPRAPPCVSLPSTPPSKPLAIGGAGVAGVADAYVCV
eukprot:4028642-Pleurochrysis_carterae.AAC.2